MNRKAFGIGFSVIVSFLAGMLSGKLGSSKLPSEIANQAISSKTVRETKDANLSSPSTKGGGPAELIFRNVTNQQYKEMILKAMASTDPNENASLLQVLFSEWAKKDTLAALAFAKENNKDTFMQLALHYMAKEKPEEAIAWAKENSANADQLHYFSLGIYAAMAEVNPVRTVAYLEKLPAGLYKYQYLADAADAWAQQDIKSAFKWIEKITLTPETNYIYTKVMTRFIEQSPREAASLIAAMESGENKVGFASNVASHLANEDIDYALKWVDGLVDNEKRYAMQSLMQVWASGPNGLKALDYALNHMNEPFSDQIFLAVASNLPSRNSKELVRAFSRMNETQQITAAEQLASYYIMNDPGQYHAWIADFEPSKVRDSAISSAINIYKKSNVKEAFKLGITTFDSDLRVRHLAQVMGEWMSVDPAVAEKTLAGTAMLSAEEKKMIMESASSLSKTIDYVVPSN